MVKILSSLQIESGNSGSGSLGIRPYIYTGGKYTAKSIYRLSLTMLALVLLFAFISCTKSGPAGVKGKYAHSDIMNDVWFEFDGEKNAKYVSYGTEKPYTYVVNEDRIEIARPDGRVEFKGQIMDKNTIKLDFFGGVVLFKK